MNKLQIVSVGTQINIPIIWNNLTIQEQNNWNWDATQSIPTGTSGSPWNFTKNNIATTSISWNMLTLTSIPPPIPLIAKSYLQSVYFIIKPNINIQNIASPQTNVLSLNLYSYSATGIPNFYNTRWSYNMLSTTTTLFAGYTYLLYALDIQRTTTGNGTSVPPIQTTFLRDPYDIYTDIPHIAMQNVITAGSTATNYQDVALTLIAIVSTPSAIVGGVNFDILECGFKYGSINNKYTLTM